MNCKTHIAFIIFRYTPFGGLERDFLAIAKAAVAAGFRVSVITTTVEGELPTEFAIYPQRICGLTNHKRWKSFISGAKNTVDALQPDVVFGFQRMPGLDFYFNGDVSFAEYFHHKYPAWMRILPRYRALLGCERAVFASDARTKILAISDSAFKYQKQYYLTPDERFVLLPALNSSISIPPFDEVTNEKIRKECHCDKNDKLILMVGSHFKTKGVDRAIRAIAKLPSNVRPTIKLAVVGRGDSESYQKLAARHAISNQVIFLGTRENVSAYYQAAYLLLHPSRTEFAGKVILEAMAHGLPVVTTSNCGFSQHVASANAGVVITETSDEAFTQGVLFAIDNPSYATWRENAVRLMQSDSMYGMADACVREILKK